MGLPPYNGPFKVGALDLEIPVRHRRSFCNNVVDPGVLNKPARKARRWAMKQNREARESRRRKQEEEAHVQEAPRSRSGAQTGNSASKTSPTASTQTNTVNDGEEHNTEGRNKNASEKEDDQEEESSWSPWSTGSKTSTLHLETVLFTIYYPALAMTEAEEKQYPKAAWLGRPIRAGVGALLQYVGQYGAFAVPASPAVAALISARMSARVGPPLADPEELRRQAHPERQVRDRAKAGNFGKWPPQFPVVIFSHGLAGNRLSYSQYCGELASQGISVAAIEHRDGSGVSSIVRGEEAPSKVGLGRFHMPHIVRHKSSGRMKASVPYFTFEKIGLQSFAENPSEQESNLRQDQIAMRHAEIEETLYVLNEINQGRGYEIVRRSTRNLGSKLAGHAASAENRRLPANSLLRKERPLEDWKGKLDMEFPTLCGHSFGGATVIEMMRKANVFPIAIVLDPWVQPVRDPAKQEDEVKGRIGKPIYVLNSESFTVWEEHFEKLKRICLDARKVSGRGWLLTLTGSKHTDFSDYPFLLPRIFKSTVGPSQSIEVFCKATYKQMGLSRQRRREQQNGPGYKVDMQGSLSDGSPNSNKDNSHEVGPSDSQTASLYSKTTDSNQVASPTKMIVEAGATCVTPLAGNEPGLGRRGNVEVSETVVRSPVDLLEQGDGRHEAVNTHANANEEEAATHSFEKCHSRNAETEERQKESRPQASTSNRTECSCQELKEECTEESAATGQEARDIVGARQRQARSNERNKNTGDQRQQGQAKDFITDNSHLDMIDADQDVQQVHEQLEGIADKFTNKSKWSETRAERSRCENLEVWARLVAYLSCKAGFEDEGGISLGRVSQQHGCDTG